MFRSILKVLTKRSRRGEEYAIASAETAKIPTHTTSAHFTYRLCRITSRQEKSTTDATKPIHEPRDMLNASAVSNTGIVKSHQPMRRNSRLNPKIGRASCRET